MTDEAKATKWRTRAKEKGHLSGWERPLMGEKNENTFSSNTSCPLYKM